ncbi:hypothetical protein [Streptomyces europaeiscabiei]|uniref:hypothetical protein n=1 Tax=Streptomyces europaeiscabiei TaxID=146819 RepID=UPI0038F7F6F8
MTAHVRTARVMMDTMNDDGNRAGPRQRKRTVKRPRVAPGPLHDLKGLLYRLYLEAGAPTLDKLDALVGDGWQRNKLPSAPQRDTIGRYLGAPVLPADPNALEALTVVLAQLARWNPNEAVRQVLEAWVREKQHPTEPLRTVGQWDPYQLGLHVAIAVGEQEEELGDAPDQPLTPYLERAHDRALRRRLHAAWGGSAVLALLVGGSATGKSRALYEAVSECLPDWPLLKPRDTDELKEWLDLEAIDAETVLWLDEAQRFLPGTAGALARLMERTHALAVVGGIWPQYWAAMVGQPDPSLHDPYFDVRTLVNFHRPRIRVAERLDDDQIDSMRALGGSDSRLRSAVKTGLEDRKIIQHLTGGPELVAGFEADTFTDLEKSVITAALDARRLGHTSAISPSLLADAAAGALPGHLRITADPNWINTVLHSICYDADKSVSGALTALIPDRVAPGMGPPDGYHPTPYLLQHAHRSRRFDVPPEAFWNAAARHARTPEDLAALAEEAEFRFRLRHAASLYKRAAETGDTQAIPELVTVMERAGHFEEAERIALLAADIDDAEAVRALVALYERVGWQDSAERLAVLAADEGTTDALWDLSEMRETAGEFDESERLTLLAAEEGNASALWRLALDSAGAGRWEEAEELAVLADEAGPTGALWDLAEMRERAGQFDESERLLLLAADRDDPHTRHRLSRIRAGAGRWEEAEELAVLADEAGPTGAIRALTRMRDDAGEFDEAERLTVQAPAGARPHLLWDLSRKRVWAGRREDAKRLAQQAADTGSTVALCDLSKWQAEDGQWEEAERLARLAAASGDTTALIELVLLKGRVGEFTEAERLALLVADAGDSHALAELVRRGETILGRERVEYLAEHDVAAGNIHMLTWLSRMRADEGDWEEAERLARLDAEGGKFGAFGDLSRMRADEGKWAESERLARLAADAGQFGAFAALSRIRADEGNWEEAERLARLDAEGGATMTLMVLAMRTGNREDRERLARLAADAGDSTAFDRLVLARAKAGDTAMRHIGRFGLDADGSASDPW